MTTGLLVRESYIMPLEIGVVRLRGLLNHEIPNKEEGHCWPRTFRNRAYTRTKAFEDISSLCTDLLTCRFPGAFPEINTGTLEILSDQYVAGSTSFHSCFCPDCHSSRSYEPPL